MAKQVIKRDGTKEPFDGEKIKRSIEVASVSAGLKAERMNEVVNKVLGGVLEIAAGKDEITTTELAEGIFKEMSKIEPEAAKIWKKYEEEKIRSQDNPFISRGNNF